MDKQSVTFRGVPYEYYLDDEGKRVLPESLHEHANWLIHIGKYTPVNSESPSEEKKDVNKLIKKLESAIKIYSTLAPSNQDRILNFKAKDMLDEILSSAKMVQDEPLPKKTTLENLYRTFYSVQYKGLGKKALGRDGARSIFQDFMAVVVRHVENIEFKIDEKTNVKEGECERHNRIIGKVTSQYTTTLKNMKKRSHVEN